MPDWFCCFCCCWDACRSVPSGRVGAQREAVFRSNDQFREAVAQREMQDITELEGKLQRK